MASKAAALSSTTRAMTMTTQPLTCTAPVLTADFENCHVPGGLDLWQNWGYYSPGVCFIGYVALCTQTSAPSNGWPVADDETAVRCVPIGYECNAKTADQRYAVSLYNNEITLSAPAFEIRWRSGDVGLGFTQHPSTTQSGSAPISTSATEGNLPASSAAPASEPKQINNGAASRVSAGGIAGIVIGAGTALCALVWVVFVMTCRRRSGAVGVKPVVKESGRHKGVEGPCQLDGRPIAELQSDGQTIKELASNRPKQNAGQDTINKHPVELPGDLRIVLRGTQLAVNSGA